LDPTTLQTTTTTGTQTTMAPTTTTAAMGILAACDIGTCSTCTGSPECTTAGCLWNVSNSVCYTTTTTTTTVPVCSASNCQLCSSDSACSTAGCSWNNITSACLSKPNLLRHAFASRVYSSENQTFWLTVRNAGNTVAGASKFRVRIDIGRDGTWDVTSTIFDVSALNPNTVSSNIVFSWDPVSGGHNTETCVDFNNEVDESNENDNCQVSSGWVP